MKVEMLRGTMGRGGTVLEVGRVVEVDAHFGTWLINRQKAKLAADAPPLEIPVGPLMVEDVSFVKTRRGRGAASDADA